MSKAKKIGIAVIIVCCVVGIGVAAWYFVTHMSQPDSTEQPPENSNVVVETTTNNNASNSNTQSSNPVTNTTSSTVTELGTDNPIESSLEPDAEWQLVEKICIDMLSKNVTQNAESYFSDNIPEKFSTSMNSILMYNSGAPVNPQSYNYDNCQIMVHSVVKISGVYNRHILNVSAVDKTSGLENAFRVNIVLNSNTGKVVYYDQSVVAFRQVPMVESQYAEVAGAYDKGEFADTRKVQAQLLLIYSYSPFIDGQYWSTIPKVIEFGNSEELSGITGYSDFGNSMNSSNTDIDVVTAIERGWLPSLDGSGARVVSIGTPELLNRMNGYSYYKTTIMYRTDHNDEFVDDKLTGVVLTVCVNDSTGKIESLVESDPTISNVPAGAGDINSAMSMKEYLGM